MKTLIVDDSRDLLEALRLGFKFLWPECLVLTVENGEKALEIFSRENPDIVLLDIAMPGIDGFEVLRQLRDISDTPIIMLTVKEAEMDKVKALEMGADDYVTKPFGSLELLARIKAVLRRAEVPPPSSTTPLFTCGDLTINYSSQAVTLRGNTVKLTPTEYRLLCALARHPNQIIGREALLVGVWGGEHRGETDFLKVYVKRLRDKLEDDPANPHYIITEWGRGYKLASF